MQFSLAVLATFVATAFAQSPSGNAFSKPGQGEVVPAGVAYSVQWKADTPGPVKLSLLYGDTTQSLQNVADLVSNLDNKGTWSWTPKTTLKNGGIYGIMLVDQGTGAFQYTNPFNISNASGGSATGSTSSSATGSTTVTTTSTSVATLTSTTSLARTNTTSVLTSSAAANITTGIAVPTGPTSSIRRTSTSTTTSATATASTGAAIARSVGAGLLGVFGVMAFAF